MSQVEINPKRNSSIEAISEQDEDLHATIKWLKQEKGKTGALASGLERYLEIIHYDDVNVSLQEQLKQVISIAIIDKIASNWHEMYGKLTLFKALHHHTNIPKSYKDKSLHSWVLTQRKRYKNNSLSPDKIKLLEAIGFKWNIPDANWYRFYEELKVFKAANNHCNVPVTYKPLGHWVSSQRQRYKNIKLSENKIRLLEMIGFEWKRK